MRNTPRSYSWAELGVKSGIGGGCEALCWATQEAYGETSSANLYSGEMERLNVIHLPRPSLMTHYWRWGFIERFDCVRDMLLPCRAMALFSWNPFGCDNGSMIKGYQVFIIFSDSRRDTAYVGNIAIHRVVEVGIGDNEIPELP